MKIKESLLLASLAPLVGLSISAQAAPLISIGDSVDVFFNGSSSLKWQSNIFYVDEGEQDDYVLTLSPGFEVNVGRGVSNLDLSIITRYDIVRYDDLAELDAELLHFQANGVYQTSRWDVSGLVSFDENKSATTDGSQAARGELVETDSSRANLESEYHASPKFSIGSGIRYSDREYTSHDSLADRESFTIPVDIFYELTPKVDLSVGYQYATTDVGEIRSGNMVEGFFADGYDQESHFFNVGARGDLLPKLSGFFKVGYRVIDLDDSDTITYVAAVPDPDMTERDSQGSLGLDVDLTYLVTPKVTARLQLHRGFGVGGEGQATEETSADLSASYAINANYSASVFSRYALREYSSTGLEDSIYGLGARLSYVPNEYWSFSTGYAYSENDSERVGLGYESHMLDLSASLRY
jgi:hypothetical protein